jgi:hypothetical protein
VSLNLFAYLESAPSLDEMRTLLDAHGLVYRHTLPADARWDYPMHVFGKANLRIVYHAGDPMHGESVIDGLSTQDDPHLQATLQRVLGALVQRYGGSICDPRTMRRSNVL